MIRHLLPYVSVEPQISGLSVQKHQSSPISIGSINKTHILHSDLCKLQAGVNSCNFQICKNVQREINGLFETKVLGSPSGQPLFIFLVAAKCTDIKNKMIIVTNEVYGVYKRRGFLQAVQHTLKTGAKRNLVLQRLLHKISENFGHLRERIVILFMKME